MKGKPWPLEKEKLLKDLIEAKTPLQTVAHQMELSVDAVQKKCNRLGLEVVDANEKKIRVKTTTSPNVLAPFELPDELPSIEETLKDIHAAVRGLKTPGLDRTEVFRLRGIIAGCQVYKEILVDYMDYRGLELELEELSAKYEELAKKSKDDAAK